LQRITLLKPPPPPHPRARTQPPLEFPLFFSFLFHHKNNINNNSIKIILSLSPADSSQQYTLINKYYCI
jgi:hypothetical protein